MNTWTKKLKGCKYNRILFKNIIQNKLVQCLIYISLFTSCVCHVINNMRHGETVNTDSLLYQKLKLKTKVSKARKEKITRAEHMKPQLRNFYVLLFKLYHMIEKKLTVFTIVFITPFYGCLIYCKAI